MVKTIALVLAHAVNWDGAPDITLRMLNGREAIHTTLETIGQVQGVQKTVIVTTDAPEDAVYEAISLKQGVGIYRGSTTNVLERLKGAFEQEQADIAIYTPGIHPFMNPELAKNLLDHLIKNDLDLTLPPITFPAHFSSIAFRYQALLKAVQIIEEKKRHGEDVLTYLARPLPFIHENPQHFKVDVYPNIPEYTDETLKKIREQTKSLYLLEAPEFNKEKNYSPASIMEFKYRFSIKLLPKPSRVLDIACGPGYGTVFAAEACGEAVGVDLDADAIRTNLEKWKDIKNVRFYEGNAQALPFSDNSFDAILSMETIEHVPDVDQYVSEMHRVLRPGGNFICTTPQSSLPFGNYPYIPWHLREFSLEQFKQALSPKFEIIKIYGIFNGLIRTDSEVGNSMIAFCRRK